VGEATAIEEGGRSFACPAAETSFPPMSWVMRFGPGGSYARATRRGREALEGGTVEQSVERALA
jgi:hypothetical protein